MHISLKLDYQKQMLYYVKDLAIRPFFFDLPYTLNNFNQMKQDNLKINLAPPPSFNG